MQVDIAFDFAKIYDITKFDVTLGQKFSLLTAYDSSKWFSDNDPALAIVVKGANAEVEATAIGDVTILIMDGKFGVQKQLNIRVVETIDMATSLGVTAEPAEPK